MLGKARAVSVRAFAFEAASELRKWLRPPGLAKAGRCT